MKVLRYEAPRQARIVESTPPRAMGKQSVARTLMTSISAGTEMGFYRGTAPQIHSRTDQHQLFHAAPHHVTYPMQSDEPGVWWMGYSAVGCVVEVGPDETNLCNGDLVWAQQGHKSMMVSDRFVRLPPDIDIARASFLALLDIAFNGMLDARVKLLDEVTVFGMGTLGLLLLQMCRRSGARVTAVDSLATRLELAVKLGAHRVLNPTTEGDVGVRVQEATGGRGADVDRKCRCLATCDPLRRV
jgi:threonine dehydrogenase-like Zn-dependent dehydrogenase